MSLMHRIVNQMLQDLVAAELIELVPEASLEALELEIVESMGSARGFSQATPFLAERLVASKWVIELYASDDQIRHIMKNLEI